MVIYLNDHPPAHVHVIHANGDVKVRLGNEPAVVLVRGPQPRTVRRALELVRTHQAHLVSEWERIHGEIE